MKVYIPEGSFAVLDHGDIPADTADWSNDFVAVMSAGALIATGIHTGHVRVQALTGPPPAAPEEERRMLDEWDEVVEVTVHAPAGDLRTESLHTGPVDDLPLLSAYGSGPYRLRVHARGRDIARDKVRNEPVEDYLLLAWPASDASGTLILRGTAETAETPRTPSPPIPADAHGEGQRRHQANFDHL
ncbi:hypothetical protein [Streptomyces longispororuber]|uniref:hypothetical protein n=1 Tax=Streptomyces longispororuber TaxID=68230 RepID=UPI0036F78AB8